MGAFIDEALRKDPHWYYDLKEFHATNGTWISDYTDRQKGRFRDGIKAVELSKQGLLIQKTAQYLVKHKAYDHDLYFKMIDDDLLSSLDGTPLGCHGGNLLRLCAMSIKNV